ncbi:hypothetical protein PRO82_001960 [Candidatus Protochlamydia amoebophila]|nr:hypothetical protein [Candidatus Protochlamydia amoebophila]
MELKLNRLIALSLEDKKMAIPKISIHLHPRIEKKDYLA